MMMDLNAKSVNFRYGTCDLPPEYKFNYMDCGFDSDDGKVLLQAAINIDCYCYQSCEFNEFERTLTFKTLNNYKDQLLSSYKKWLIKNNMNNGNDWKDVSIHDLPYSSEMKWGF